MNKRMKSTKSVENDGDEQLEGYQHYPPTLLITKPHTKFTHFVTVIIQSISKLA